jgi:hypothetical protein
MMALAVAGCGREQTRESPAPAAAVDPATASSITGTVTLEGAPPVFRPIDMSASPVCVQANPTPVVPPVVVTSENGALADVVVYVKDGLGRYRFETPADPVVLDQKNCMYAPHIVALMTNQTFEIQNSDATLHNVHPMPRHNRQWNTSQPAGAAALKSSFARPELAIPVVCSVHPWMRAFVFAFDHPYFAVTSTTGKFALKNLPPGTYTIEAWHEQYKTLDQTVTLAPRESKSISFTFPSAGPSAD